MRCCYCVFMRPSRPGLTNGTRCRPATCDAGCRRACGPWRRWPSLRRSAWPAGCPRLSGGPLRDPVQDDPGCLEQVGAQQRVAVLRDTAGVIVLAGLEAPRCQADIGAHARRLCKTLRIVDAADVGQCPMDKSGDGAIPSQGGRVVLRPWHVLLRPGDGPLHSASKAYQLFPVCFCVPY